MADYQKMYHVLFAATEDALTLLEENMGACGELGVPMRVRLLLEEAQKQLKRTPEGVLFMQFSVGPCLRARVTFLAARK